MWSKRGNTNLDDVYAGNLDLVREVIIKDDKVSEIMERKWESVQQEYPHATRNKFEEFWSRLWSSWVCEKKKLATRKVNQLRRKSTRKARKASSDSSDDSPVGPSKPATTPTNRIMPPQNPTESPQSPPIASVVDQSKESMTDIIVKTSQKVRADTSTASNFSLLPPSDSITPQAWPADTPSSDSSAVTPANVPTMKCSPPPRLAHSVQLQQSLEGTRKLRASWPNSSRTIWLKDVCRGERC
jgi:hypothetical protein